MREPVNCTTAVLRTGLTANRGTGGQVSHFPFHFSFPFSYSFTTRLAVELERANADAIAV